MKRLAVLVSGAGSLLEAMIEKELPIQLVVADRKCRGIYIAKAAGIHTELFERKDLSHRFDYASYTRDMVHLLKRSAIDFVAMAGFKTIFTQSMFDFLRHNITNSHPALLPAFKGDYAVRDTLAYGVKVTGCTIHVATAKLDEGPILAQEAVRVEEGDTIDILWERIKCVERVLYPKTIRQHIYT